MPPQMGLHLHTPAIPVATEVAPGWWLGGRYSHHLGLKWSGVLDCTCEFPEMAACEAPTPPAVGSESEFDARLTQAYRLLPLWDGCAPKAEELDAAARFVAERKQTGPVLVHCAHGRGRSTCCLVASMVRAGEHATWEEAFAAVKQVRTCVSLNAGMRKCLTEWQDKFVTKKA